MLTLGTCFYLTLTTVQLVHGILSVSINLQLKCCAIFLVNSSLICNGISCACVFVSTLVTWKELSVSKENPKTTEFLWKNIRYNTPLGVGITVTKTILLPLFSIQIDFHFYLGSILFGSYLVGFKYTTYVMLHNTTLLPLLSYIVPSCIPIYMLFVLCNLPW